jgi:hypothetical protein
VIDWSVKDGSRVFGFGVGEQGEFTIGHDMPNSADMPPDSIGAPYRAIDAHWLHRHGKLPEGPSAAIWWSLRGHAASILWGVWCSADEAMPDPRLESTVGPGLLGWCPKASASG